MAEDPKDQKPIEGEKEVVSTEEYNKLKGALEGVTNELKEIRSDRAAKAEEVERLSREKEELADKLSKLSNGSGGEMPEDEKVKNIVMSVLNEKDASSAEANKQAALAKFISENKEYHPDNDVSGLKLDALKKKMSRFNTQGLKSLDDFYSVIKESNILLGRDNSQEASKEIENPYSDSPKIDVSAKKMEISDLSDKEKELVKRGTVSKEKLQELREKKPEFLRQLLSQIS